MYYFAIHNRKHDRHNENSEFIFSDEDSHYNDSEYQDNQELSEVVGNSLNTNNLFIEWLKFV